MHKTKLFKVALLLTVIMFMFSSCAQQSKQISLADRAVGKKLSVRYNYQINSQILDYKDGMLIYATDTGIYTYDDAAKTENKIVDAKNVTGFFIKDDSIYYCAEVEGTEYNGIFIKKQGEASEKIWDSSDSSVQTFRYRGEYDINDLCSEFFVTDNFLVIAHMGNYILISLKDYTILKTERTKSCSEMCPYKNDIVLCSGGMYLYIMDLNSGEKTTLAEDDKASSLYFNIRNGDDLYYTDIFMINKFNLATLKDERAVDFGCISYEYDYMLYDITDSENKYIYIFASNPEKCAGGENIPLSEENPDDGKINYIVKRFNTTDNSIEDIKTVTIPTKDFFSSDICILDGSVVYSTPNRKYKVIPLY